MMIQAIQSAAPFRALCVALAAAGLKSKNSRSSDRSMLFRQMGDGTAAFPAAHGAARDLPAHSRALLYGPTTVHTEGVFSHADSNIPVPGHLDSLVTPFSGGAVDGGALRRLVRHYAAAGVDGLVVCGSTGEAAALDDAEQLAVLDAVLNVADGLPVMMGLAGNHQGHVLRRLSAFGTRPLAGILAPAPYYVRPDRPARPPISVAWPTPRASAGAVRHSLPHRRGAGHGHAAGAGGAPNIAAIRTAAARWKRPWR